MTVIEGEPEAVMQFWRGHIDQPLFVYFIQAACPDYGPVKIGKTLDPQKRLTELQCGNPVELVLRSVILAGLDTEHLLHKFLRRDAWVRGEWFGRGWESVILSYSYAASEKQVDLFMAGDHPTEVIDHAIRMAAQLALRDVA